jgi:protein-S-isoprenylcysteine O-methyltransferase Ste14
MVGDALFHGLFWALFGGIMVIRVLSVLQVRRAGERFTPDAQAVKQEGRLAFSVRVVAFLFLIGMLVAYALNPGWMRGLDFPLPGAAHWVGFGLGLLGLATWAWAQVTLGRQWSAQVQLREEHQLVTGGPYAWVRHPLYAALVGISIAFALVTANWLFAAFGVLAIGFLPSRILHEEKMMKEGVPGYGEYSARVRFRLLPGVW